MAVVSGVAAVRLSFEKEQTTEALREAKAKTLVAERRLAENYLARALTMAETPESRGWALLWLTRALASVPEEAGDLDRVIRINLAEVSREVHRLRAVLMHQKEVLSAAFSPDGDTARLWNVETGKRIGEPLRHTNQVAIVAFSPDSRIALTGGKDKLVRLWDAATGQLIGTPLEHREAVETAGFSADGRRLLIGDGSGARLWDVAARQPIGNTLPHRHAVAAIAFSPDGRRLLTASHDTTARLWDVAPGRAASVALADGDLPLGFRSDGQLALVATRFRTVSAWDLAARKPGTRSWPLPARIVRGAFFPDGNSYVASCENGAVVHIATRTGRQIGAQVKHPSVVYALAVSPDGKTLFTGASDARGRLLDAGPKRLVKEFAHPGEVMAALFRGDGQTLLTGCGDGRVRSWDVATGQSSTLALTHGDWITALALGPGERTLLTGSMDRTARLWDATTGEPLSPALPHPGGVTAVAFSPDGRTLLTGSVDRAARLWDAATGQPLGPSLGLPDMVTCVAFAPDGKTALSGSRERVSSWNLAAPVAGDIRELTRWVEAWTGLEMDEQGIVRVLDGPAWAERLRELKDRD